MKKPLRKLLAGIALATAAATGTFIATESAATPQGDTAWGAPNTASDTAWGTPPADDTSHTTVNPADTAWG